MDCNKKNCNGSLVRVGKYYVCDTCCRDIITKDEVIKISAGSRNVFVDKPKGKSIEIKDPEFMGFYPYEVVNKTKWRTNYKLIGRNGSVIGALVIADYSKCNFIESNEPKYMAHLHHKDYVVTISIKEDEIIFWK